MKRHWAARCAGLAVVCGLAATGATGCGDDDDEVPPGTTGGAGGIGGTGGAGGTGGGAGEAGSGGAAGMAGAAGSAGSASFDLSFDGTGFTPHNGQVMRVAVRREDNQQIVAEEAFVVNEGTFAFMWPDALEQGAAYTLDYFADFNESGACDSPPTDHVWRDAIPSVTGVVDISVVHNTNFTDSCASFTTTVYDFGFEGTGFAPHEGQMLSMALRRGDTDEVVARNAAVVSSGAFAFGWMGLLLDGQAYRLDYYADFNENGQCDVPPTDHVWSIDLGTVAADVAIAETHNVNFTDVCSSFP